MREMNGMEMVRPEVIDERARSSGAGRPNGEAIERPHSWWIDALAGALDRHLATEFSSDTPWIADTIARLGRVQRLWIEELRSLAEVASRTAEPQEMARIVAPARSPFSAPET